MKKIILLTGLCLFIAMLFFSCGAAQGTKAIEKFVSKDSIAYVHIANGEELFEKTDGFIENTGLSKFASRGLKSVIKMAIAMQGSQFDFEWFDLTKPIGVIILSENADSPGSILLCPVKNGDQDMESIIKLAESIGMKGTEKYDNYAVMFSDEALKDNFPPEETLDVSLLNDYDPGSISYYVNPTNIFISAGVTGADLKEKLTESLEESYELSRSYGLQQPGGEDSIKASSEMIGKLIDVVEQCMDCYFSLLADGNGIAYKSSLFFEEGKWFADFCSKIESASGIKEYGKYLPDNYRFSGISNINPEVTIEFVNGM